MSVEQIAEMLDKVSKDSDFAAKFSEVYSGGEDFSGVVVFGRENGFEFTEQECKKLYDAIDANLDDELSDDDLEKVAGGVTTSTAAVVTAAVGAAVGAVGVGASVATCVVSAVK